MFYFSIGYIILGCILIEAIENGTFFHRMYLFFIKYLKLPHPSGGPDLIP